jgi:hypothetical protein
VVSGGDDFDAYLLSDDAANAPVWTLAALGKIRDAIGRPLDISAYCELRRDLEAAIAKAE